MQKIATHEVVIDIKNLYVIYNKKQVDNAFVAIKDFSYKFERGKIYCIIGESGSGKSSLINSFNGLNKPDYGSIRIVGNLLDAKKRLDLVLESKIKIDKFKKFSHNCFIIKCAKHANKNDVSLALKSYINKNIIVKQAPNELLTKHQLDKKQNFYLVSVDDDLSFLDDISTKKDNELDCILNASSKRKIKHYCELRKHVGMVYQFPEFQLFKTTVIADASFGAKNLKIKKEEANERAISCLKSVGIDESLFNNSPFGLSGGQKRRVALAGIFAIDPDIFVFDEPTAGLDPQGEKEMIKYMLNYKQQDKTIIVVTHSMDQVLSIADEVLVIHNGRLVKHGKPYDIFLDKSILKTSRIEIPLVIKTIQALVKANKKFEVLLKHEPKNIDELAKCIINVKRK